MTENMLDASMRPDHTETREVGKGAGKRIARLIQDFSGGYHLKADGRIVEFSISLAKAVAWAEKHGYELR